MRRGRHVAVAIACILICVLPLIAALLLGWRVPARRILPELPAHASADYASRFDTGFASLREAFIRQILGPPSELALGRGPLGAISPGSGQSGSPASGGDILASLRAGSGLKISPGSPDEPTAVEFRRSKDPSISAGGSVVAYLSTDTRIPGMDPLQPCYASRPGLTAQAAIWWSHRGRFSGLPQPDPGPCEQVVVKDVRSGETTIASVGPSGRLANAPVSTLMLSGDGRSVTFVTAASNLVTDDTNEVPDVFVRDLVAGRTELITVSMHGGPIRRPFQNYPEQLGYPIDLHMPDVLGSVSAEIPTISHDGRYVLFESSADDLVPGDAPQSVDVFIRDRLKGTTERVSLSSSGRPALREDVYAENRWRLANAQVRSAFPCMSPNSRYVAFRSFASNLVPGDRNGRPDIFLRDRQTGRTELITVSSSGVQQDGEAFPGVGLPWHFPWVFSYKPCVTNDGRYVVFNSSSTNLVDDDTNGQPDLFLRDRKTSTTVRVSLNADGTEATLSNEGFSCGPPDPQCEDNPPPTGEAPALSADGRFIAFHSFAELTSDDAARYRGGPEALRELDPIDPYPRRDMDLFVYEIARARLTRLDVDDIARVRLTDHEGAGADARAMAPAVSADASLIAFQTDFAYGPLLQATGGIHLYRWKE